MLYGVDVSGHQPTWEPSGREAFVGVKTTEGRTFANDHRLHQVPDSRKAGAIVLHYHFMRPGTPSRRRPISCLSCMICSPAICSSAIGRTRPKVIRRSATPRISSPKRNGSGRTSGSGCIATNPTGRGRRSNAATFCGSPAIRPPEIPASPVGISGSTAEPRSIRTGPGSTQPSSCAPGRPHRRRPASRARRRCSGRTHGSRTMSRSAAPRNGLRRSTGTF